MLKIQNQTSYDKNPCVEFLEATVQTEYVNIFKGEGCMVDTIGKSIGSFQNLSLHDSCMNLKTIMHQLVHVLGIFKYFYQIFIL